MAHPPTPYLRGRGAGLRLGATGAPAEPTEELAHWPFNAYWILLIFASHTNTYIYIYILRSRYSEAWPLMAVAYTSG